jgi:MFS family permease
VSWGAPFWRFWAATGLSNIADGLFALSLALTALRLTREPILISGLAVMEQLPWLLFSLLAGALVDRLDRRRVLVGVDLGRVTVLLVIAALAVTGHLTIWLAYLAALVMGFGETLFDTSAQAIVPAVVPHERLESANSRMQGVEVVSNYFIGPPLGGLLVGLSAALAFVTGSVLYLAASVGVLMVPGRFRPQRATPAVSIWADIAEGLRYLRGQPVLRRLGVLSGVRMLTFTAVSAILVIYAVAPGPMGLSETGFGLFAASTAIGAAFAAVTGERAVARIGAANCLKLTFVAFAVSELSPLAVNPFVVGVLWTQGTYFVIVWNVVTLSVRQRLVPQYLMGRVNSAYRLITYGAMPIGSALGGVLGHLIGARWTFAVCAAATLLLTLGTLSFTDAMLAAGRPAGELPELSAAGS